MTRESKQNYFSYLQTCRTITIKKYDKYREVQILAKAQMKSSSNSSIPLKGQIIADMNLRGVAMEHKYI